MAHTDPFITELVFVDGDDWSGLYADDELVAQGHCRQGHADLLALAAQYQQYTVRLVFVDQTWMEDQGQLPKHLDEVVITSEQTPRPELAMQ